MLASIGVLAKKTATILFLVCLVTAAFAQPDPCNIPPGTCRTETQGAYGNACHGGNAGCILRDNFPTVFPNGLIVGIGFTLTFDSSGAVKAFLPAGGPPSILTQNYTDPTSTEAGVFAGQLVTLAITLGFSNAGVTGFCQNLGDLVIPQGVHTPSGPFAGYTVNQIFQLAEVVLGGDVSVLPAGITISDLNDVLDAINSNFDDGQVSNGYLVEPDCDEILPVELLSFTAMGVTSGVEVTWVTASERNVSGYELSRQADNGTWQTAAHISGMGDNPAGHTYTYRDNDVRSGVTYRYRLTAHDIDGTVHPMGSVVSATPRASGEVTSYALSQNYPNPFNPSTQISFDLLESGNVSLKVYNLMGQEVLNLVSGNMDKGRHFVNVNGTNLATGLYLYRLSVNGFVAEKKMLLLK